MMGGIRTEKRHMMMGDDEEEEEVMMGDDGAVYIYTPTKPDT